VFKKIRKQFKGTPYAIRGDFGLGKAYLIQNKTDNALEILTAIPQRYPGHPFLRVVYLSLGDFYQAQKQWENAITALNNILADSLRDHTYKTALRQLINIYERVGVIDRALMLTRQYLREFPNDDRDLGLRIKIGGFLRATGQYQAAIRHYRSLKPLASGESVAEIQYYIAESYFEAGQFEKAIVEYLRLKYFTIPTRQPWRTTAIYKAGICNMRIKKYQRARELFQLIVRQEGANSVFGKSAAQKIREIDHILDQSNRETLQVTKG
ncbi:MAG: hypothetical protein D6814_16810, partial [Calditrichaeota bacterium]